MSAVKTERALSATREKEFEGTKKTNRVVSPRTRSFRIAGSWHGGYSREASAMS